MTNIGALAAAPVGGPVSTNIAEPLVVGTGSPACSEGTLVVAVGPLLRAAEFATVGPVFETVCELALLASLWLLWRLTYVISATTTIARAAMPIASFSTERCRDKVRMTLRPWRDRAAR
jgi:hypothetical protein